LRESAGIWRAKMRGIWKAKMRAKMGGFGRRKGRATGDQIVIFRTGVFFAVEELVKGFTMNSINGPGDARRFRALSA
jgi:hypothetical protein